MGMSRIADAATGKSIPAGEKVVALVIDRRKGGFPDAETHAALAGTSPTEIFEPVSLPIRATCGDYGDIEPRRGQVSVKLVLDLANAPDWKTFQAKAFGIDGKTMLGDGAHGQVHPAFGKSDGWRERVLGLCVFTEPTWKRLIACSRMKGRTADVDAVMDAMERVRGLLAAGDVDSAFANSDVLSLQRYSYIHLADGTKVDLPRLSGALSTREGGSLVGDVARKWLTRSNGGALGLYRMRGELHADTRGIVEAVWDLSAAERGLDVLGKTYLPSRHVGQYDNAPETGALALDMVQSSVDSMLLDLSDDPDSRSGPQLAALLSRLDQVRAAATERLAELTVDVAPPRGP